MPSLESESAERGIRTRRQNGYESPRTDVQAHVPLHARFALELGCSTGALGAALKHRQDVTIVGVELDPQYAAEATRHLDRVIVADVEAFLRTATSDEGPFDCLIAADILEHLVDPWQALQHAVALLSPGATVIVSVPNVIYWRGLWRLIRGGAWPRDDHGIFDRTHLHWFTLADTLALLHHAGLHPDTIDPRYWASGWRLAWRRVGGRTFLARYLPPQYIVSATKEA